MAALRQLDSFVDISEDDLVHLVQILRPIEPARFPEKQKRSEEPTKDLSRS